MVKTLFAAEGYILPYNDQLKFIVVWKGNIIYEIRYWLLIKLHCKYFLNINNNYSNKILWGVLTLTLSNMIKITFQNT